MSEAKNPKATEYWDGYRSATIEVLLTGIEQIEAKYWAEHDTDTPYARGFRAGVKNLKDDLSRRLKDANG